MERERSTEERKGWGSLLGDGTPKWPSQRVSSSENSHGEGPEAGLGLL